MAGERPTKKLRCIQRSVDRHWVGDGFPVRTLLAYPNLGPVIDPFLLLDYAGPTEFPPTTERLGVGRAPAPRLRDGDDRLRRRGRAPRLLGRRRADRPGRRAVDDRRVGHRARGVPRARLRAARRPLRDGAALGEPARRSTSWRRRATRASLAAQIPAVRSAGRQRQRARDRRRVRRSEGPGAHVHADRTSGICGSRAGSATELARPRRPHDGARRAARRAARERLRADPRRRGRRSSTAPASASRIDAAETRPRCSSRASRSTSRSSARARS